MTARTAPAVSAARARTLAAERRQLMQALHPVVQMLGTIVGHHVEVVLHDLTQPQRSIVAIANGHVSNRRIGNPILSGPKDDRGFAAARQTLTQRGQAVHSIVDGYPTLTRAGTRLKSSTVVFRDAAGEPFAALCLNADLTIAEAAHAWLSRLLQGAAAAAPASAEPPDMDALMHEIIGDAVRRLGKPVALMNKEEKVQAVQAMMQRGLFIVKGGVGRAAASLGVTRFTIYNYLELLRRRGDGAAGNGTPAGHAQRPKPATRARGAPGARR
ncbi:MAG: PAS domain-containing protein [Proteobacteria bacterium]|nr:PAS domain-containing protein [Pseudomonadota bacterium]